MPLTQGPSAEKKSAGKLRVVAQEGGRLHLPPELDQKTVRRLLVRLNATLPQDVFTLDRQGIRISAVVGMVDIGICQIEILPKVSATSSVEENAQFLLDMLKASGSVSPAQFLKGNVLTKSEGILEPVIHAFAEDLWLKLVEGPPRRYSNVSELSPVIRGRIRFESIATTPPGNDQLVPIRYSQLQLDNDLSRLILTVIYRLKMVTRSLRNRRLLEQCATAFDGVLPTALTPELTDSIHTSRLEAHWEPVVAFARALAWNRSPDVVSVGQLPFFSVLFNLDELFEAALRKSLRLALTDTPISLATHLPNFPLLRSLVSGVNVLRMRPDYLFVSTEKQDDKRLVGDAKWKRLLAQSASFGLKPADAYQLTAYMTSHNLQKGILFFPMDEWMIRDAEPGCTGSRSMGGAGTVTICAVDVRRLVGRSDTERKGELARLRSLVYASLS